MKTRLLSLLLVTAALVAVSPAHADEASHRKAAIQLCETFGMSKMLDSSIDVMLNAQLEANPGLAPKKAKMRDFFAKHLSWASLKDDLIKIYTDAFTETELKELNAFYGTPVGKKAITVMPELMQKGAQLGMSRVQAHLGELQKLLSEPEKAEPSKSAKPAKK